MLPLLLPWFAIVLILAAIILSFCKKWRYGLLLIVLAIVVNWWSECVPFRLWTICEKSGTRNIRVMTLNISGTKEKNDEKVEKLAKLIVKNNPDIIHISELGVSNKALLDTLLAKHYPYNIFGYYHGIYSKHPLVKRMTFGNDDFATNDVIKYQSVVGEDTIAFLGCHLASNNYTVDSKYITPDSIKNYSSLVQYASDINLAYSKRINGAEDIVYDICQLNKPVIVLGDMNDVGGSKTIRQIEEVGLKDAWWEGGFGYGATIHKPLPYRIDHILYSNQFKLNRVKVVRSEDLSDHNAVFAEFSY